MTATESAAMDVASHRPFAIEIADANFEFARHPTDDRKIVGLQVLEAFGAHPPQDFVVLHHLPSGELETLRPVEAVDLGDGEIHRFFVIEGSDLHRFTAEGLSMEWPRPSLTADQIIFLARADEDSEVVLHRGDGPAEVFEADDEVRIDLPGAEMIRIRAARQITILVDAEPYTPPRRRMTPNEIITNAANANPAENYLVQIKGRHRVSYEGKGDIPIRLRDGMSFQVIFTGATPVSDPGFETGPLLFMKGLAALGYAPRQLTGLKDHIVFDYVVESGRFAGRTVRHGFVVPADFPLTWPSGPHVSPDIHPIKADGQHPDGGVHQTHAQPFAAAEGGSWQYWSRPYSHKGGISEPVTAYLTHLWKLWATQ